MTGSAVDLSDEAASLRREIVETLFRCGGGHYGGSLSVLDILHVLFRKGYYRPAKLNPSGPTDRLILSKGHAAIALYALLRRVEVIDEPLSSYATLGSPLEGHPDMAHEPAVDFSSGSLGQGLSVGLGMVTAMGRLHGSLPSDRAPRVWVILGDGECQEGQVWEAALLASRWKATALCAVVDCNQYQEVGFPGQLPVPALRAKWESFGWRVLEADGHDAAALNACYDVMLQAPYGPAVLLAHTVKGKGFRYLEQRPFQFHCATVTPAEHALILESECDARG